MKYLGALLLEELEGGDDGPEALVAGDGHAVLLGEGHVEVEPNEDVLPSIRGEMVLPLIRWLKKYSLGNAHPVRLVFFARPSRPSFALAARLAWNARRGA